MLEVLFSPAHRYKGKFPPRPSHLSPRPLLSSPGPTSYFESPSPSPQGKNLSPVGFLSSTDRFDPLKSFHSSIGPVLYTPQACVPRCSK